MYIRGCTNGGVLMGMYRYLGKQAQLGERQEIDAACAKLPDSVRVYGWLGDSILTSKFETSTYLARLASQGIFFTEKPMAQTAAEYFAMFESITGVPFDTSPLSARFTRRHSACTYASKWLSEKHAFASASQEEKQGMTPPGSMPTLEFAISVEGLLECNMNAQTGKMEIYDKVNGVWTATTGDMLSCKGEALSDALLSLYGARSWKLVENEAKRSWRLTKADVALFHGGALGPIGEMLKHLQLRTDLSALDEGPSATKLVNFKGVKCLDFSVPRPSFDWDDDEQLLAALSLPVRDSVAADRTVRSTPTEFLEYHHPDKLALARAMKDIMEHLKDHDTILPELGDRLRTAAAPHVITQKVFMDAHNDVDSSFYQLRICMEPCSDTGTRCQVASLVDDGTGGTSKGTFRELAETALGVHNGKTQLGYSAVGRQEMIVAKGQEAPSELTANIFLCKHLWIDDFKPEQPLTTAILRQISGQNNLSSARKCQAEFVFKFKGQFFLACNGLWKPDVPWIGSDKRRHSGLTFSVQYVDQPEGPNQRAKDSAVKEKLAEGRAEFWFLVRLFWLLPQPRPREDHTEPQPPNTLALAAQLMGNQCDFVIDEVSFEQFADERLMDYVLGPSKPGTIEVENALSEWMSAKFPAVAWSEKDSKNALRRWLHYDPGHGLAKYGARKKVTINCYTRNGAIVTSKPAPLFGGGSA